jgi:hypothetical protein
VIETPGAEERALDEHLPALFRDGATRRDEHESSVCVGTLAGRCLGYAEGTSSEEGGEEPEPTRAP